MPTSAASVKGLFPVACAPLCSLVVVVVVPSLFLLLSLVPLTTSCPVLTLVLSRAVSVPLSLLRALPFSSRCRSSVTRKRCQTMTQWDRPWFQFTCSSNFRFPHALAPNRTIEILSAVWPLIGNGWFASLASRNRLSDKIKAHQNKCWNKSHTTRLDGVSSTSTSTCRQPQQIGDKALNSWPTIASRWHYHPTRPPLPHPPPTKPYPFSAISMFTLAANRSNQNSSSRACPTSRCAVFATIPDSSEFGHRFISITWK